MQRRLFTLAATALAATSLAAPLAARAQAWPAHPVKLVVGFPGGSTPDMVARAISEPLAQALGQPVIVENKPGASGNIAADYVAKATDGLTLGIVINGNLTSSKMLYSKLPYDPGKDFSYISLLTTAPLILVAPTSEPAGAAFFAEAKQQGDKWNYGSVGAGSVAHLGMELLKSKVPGLKPLHVPYNGNPAVVTGLIGGQVQMALMPPGVAMPQVKGGKLRHRRHHQRQERSGARAAPAQPGRREGLQPGGVDRPRRPGQPAQGGAGQARHGGRPDHENPRSAPAPLQRRLAGRRHLPRRPEAPRGAGNRAAGGDHPRSEHQAELTPLSR